MVQGADRSCPNPQWLGLAIQPPRGWAAALLVAALLGAPWASAAEPTQPSPPSPGAAPSATQWPGQAPATQADAWQLADGRPSALTLALIDRLSAAADEGLDPRDYGLPPLRRRLAASADATVSDAKIGQHAEPDPTSWGELMRPRLAQFLRDLRHGRLPAGQGYAGYARHIGLLDADRDGPWLQRAVDELAAGAPWESVRARIAPPQPGHDRLRQALREARAWAADDSLPAAVRHKARTDAERLTLALAVQRHMPRPATDRWLQVNIADYRLQLMTRDADGRARVAGSMRVIVGKASQHQTPGLLGGLRTIAFSPYWNVPPSIARDELVPKLKARPALAASMGYEIVMGGRVLRQFGSAELDAVLAGQARIRQRPGPRNALGRIKFLFPNPQNIYLHHTPSVSLFQRDRRDFSHGCVRVEDPVRLARFVIGDDPAWTEARIEAAMAAPAPEELILPQVLPVILAYNTVVADGSEVRYLRDVYRLDARLRRQLSALPPTRYPIAADTTR